MGSANSAAAWPHRSHASVIASPITASRQLVLGREVAVEGLQRDTGLGDEFLGGEIVFLTDEPPRGVEHQPHLVGDAGARPLN